MAKLIYTGPKPEAGVVPLPEGWPAADHDEPDAAIAKEKVASGSYQRATKADEKTAQAGEEEKE